MKCGLICARSARTSASISRVREASSSASSSWPETHCATSSAARARPAVGYGANAASVPTIRSSTTSGLTTAVRTAQPGTSHGRSPRPKDWVRPFSTVVADQRADLALVVPALAVPREAARGVGDAPAPACRAGRAGAGPPARRWLS